MSDLLKERTIRVLFFALAAVLLRAEAPVLIPRTAFFGGDTKANFRISPDGSMLAFLGVTANGTYGVWIQTPGREDARIVTDEPAAAGTFRWGYDNRHLLFLQDNNGDENFHLFGLDIQTREVHDFTPFPGVKAQNLLLERKRPGEVLIGLNRRDHRIFDMHRINLKTGDLALECENPGDVRWWLADAELNVRAAVALDPKNAATVLRTRKTREAPWKDIRVWPFGETGLLEGYGSEIAVAFTADGRSLYVQAAFDSDMTELARLNAGTGRVEEILASDPRACLWMDFDQTLFPEVKILLHPVTRVVRAVGFNRLIPEWKVLSPEVVKDFEILRKARPGIFWIVGQDNSGEQWVVQFRDDRGPGAILLYDRRTRIPILLAETQTQTAKYPFAAMKPVVIKSRDGLDLPSYLVLPVGLEPKSLPLILMVHGGPWTRDNWGYSLEPQWLANRGYAVLRVNFRGSREFGKAFLNAGNGEWGGRMNDDLTDAVRWAVGEGIADPKRVAIYGTSYGGYAALAGPCFSPETYACAVAESGISNVRSFLQTMPEWWAPIKTRWLRRIGNALADDAFNERISPLFHADKIRAKLLIYHGTNDPRCKIAESNQMVRRIRETGGEVDYIVYSDEGHGIRQWANALDRMGRTEEFLAKHLGGRFEPWVRIERSTAQVK